jgi:hypothetical protein
MPEKFDFRKYIAIEKVTYKLAHVMKSINQIMHGGRIFSDLEKVTNFVNHYILLSSLHIEPTFQK